MSCANGCRQRRTLDDGPEASDRSGVLPPAKHCTASNKLRVSGASCQIRASRSETALTATAIEEADIRSAQACGARTTRASERKRPRPPELQMHCKPSPGEIFFHLANALATESQRVRYVDRIQFHQHHSGRLNGHIRPSSDRDVDIRLNKGRGVIHAVAHHRRYLPLSLQALDVIRFLLRSHLSEHS